MTPTVLPQFPSTGPKLMSCPCWYTRSAFPVPTHLLFHLVHQKHVSCTNTSFISFGTPEARLLYQHISYFIWYTRSTSPVPTHLLFHLVHQKCVSCTNGIFLSIWYTRSTSLVPTHLLFHLVHQKHVSCTNGAPQYIRCITKASSRTFSVLWNNRRPVLPGMKSYAHLKQHSLDN